MPDRNGADGSDRTTDGSSDRTADGDIEGTDVKQGSDVKPSYGRGAGSELPVDLIDEAERLTRLARRAVDDGERGAYLDRRAELLDEFGFTARVREGDDTLVLHPAEWVEDGTVRVERIDDTDRAVEVPLSDAGDENEYGAVAEHNADLVRRVEGEHGPVHAANAQAFADYMSNHYVRRMEEATDEEIREFLTEYYPRNAWPSQEQKSMVESSLAHLFDAAGTEVPGPVRRD